MILTVSTEGIRVTEEESKVLVCLSACCPMSDYLFVHLQGC
jgi:hypothetical protein